MSEHALTVAADRHQTKSRPRRQPHGEPIAVTVDDAQHLTGLGSTKIYELIQQGKLRSVTVGRRRLILSESIKTLLTP
jgi:excisionase family DNA binding protein